jgi:urease accessory protein
MGWKAHLRLSYTHDGERTSAHDRHEGPLRVLQRLYPEGPDICHHVLVHPPGGVVGGDSLELEATLAEGAHALITTPGATRFYRSNGPLASQRSTLTLAPGARLEWLPMEAIAYRGCEAENLLRFDLAPGAEMIGWDLLALGLPAANLAFDSGRFLQQIELPGVWLERGRIDACDRLLLDSPLGWAGQRAMATLWFAAGAPLAPARVAQLLDTARAVLDENDAASAAAGGLPALAGVSAPQDRVLVLRVLAARIEPAMKLLARVRAAWRGAAWGLEAQTPRIWST